MISQRVSMLDHAFAMLEKFAPKYKSEFFKVETLKIHGDGTPDGYTAGLLEPYADRPDYTGITSYTPEAQTEACLRGAKKGYDIHTHVAGDRTMRQTLDAYEAVRKAGYDELRLGLARITVGKTNLDWEEARRISLLKNRSDKYPLKPHVQEYLRRNDSLILIDVTNAEAASAGNGHAYFRKSPWVSSDILISL